MSPACIFSRCTHKQMLVIFLGRSKTLSYTEGDASKAF